MWPINRAGVAALGATAALLVGQLADAPAAHAATGWPAVTSGASPYTKVMVIAEENHTYEHTIGAPKAPYLNQLAARYGSASAMDAGYPTTCRSLTGYLLMTSGTAEGVCDDRGPSHHPMAGDNIFAQVAAAGLSWRGYGEDEPAPCARGNSPDGLFLVRHTPAAYYLTEQARCATAQVAAGTPQQGALHDDISGGTLPSFAYVTPNACHDMHGAASCPDHRVVNADAWLASWIPQVLAGPDFSSGRLVVIITWDEGSGPSNHIPTIVISPTTTQVTSATAYTHCSTLATVEDVLGLARLGCAATATAMTTAFSL